jgi:hypothetical protein
MMRWNPNADYKKCLHEDIQGLSEMDSGNSLRIAFTPARISNISEIAILDAKFRTDGEYEDARRLRPIHPFTRHAPWSY